MLSEDNIKQFLGRLDAHRQTLAHYLQRRAILSGAHEPPEVAAGINEARREIARIKDILRAYQAPIDDHPDDSDAQPWMASWRVSGTSLALTVTNEQTLLAQFSPEKGRVHIHCPPEAKFDMEFMPRCVYALDKSHGLTGFVLRCVVPAFVESFCERLRHIKGRDRLDYIADRFTLTEFDAIETVKNYAHRIVNYHRARSRKSLLCAVRLETVDAETSKQQAEMLWQTITANWSKDSPHKLIVVLFIRSATTLPEEVIQLGTPDFEEGHVAMWVADMIEYFQLPWQDRDRDEWVQRIIDGSRLGQTLHIEHVYSYLRRSLRILGVTPRPSPDAFLSELV